MTNSEIADHFSLLSKLMDIHGENSFKVKSYGIAAYNIEQLRSEISGMTEPELFASKGIGESTGKKILELIQTGKMHALEEILERTPEGILEMLHIKGLGPKKISVIWKELEIESVGELEYACNENRLVTLKGFGAKTQESILQSIAYIRQNEGYFLWSEASAVATPILTHCKDQLPAHRFELVGALRQQYEVVKHIDIITTATPTEISGLFADMANASVVSGDTDCEIQIPFQPPVRFKNSAEATFGVRVFLESGDAPFLEAFTGQYLLPETAATEEAIFEANQLPFIPPAIRRDSTILDKAAAGGLPQLINASEIKGIIHSHSKWSDGANTIEEMATAARDQGFEYLVLSDHSQSAYYANGLKPDRIAEQHIEIDALNKKLAPFRIFKSIEADILGDGGLDYTNEVLATFDLVIASVHSNLKMSQEKAMSRVLAAINNPFTTILGHPTGRLLLSRSGYPLDHEIIIDACVANKVVIEINAHPRRLDLDWRWIACAIDRGAMLSINPDAHSIAGFRDIQFGAIAAQKGCLTAANNLSSLSLSELTQYLADHRKW